MRAPTKLGPARAGQPGMPRLGQGAAKPARPQFSQPVRQVVLMLVVVVLVAAGGVLASARIFPIFLANPWLNGIIFSVFLIGVITCFWQVIQLFRSVGWIENFAAGRPGAEFGRPPVILASLASLLGQRGEEARISGSSARSILDSVGSRIDEIRDITRYLASLLIFLGLLGTFFGLAITVPAVVETIRAMAPEPGQTGLEVFARLMQGLETQLGGMATAFSSSLIGLAGSLVIGLLELFVGHGQNRFYRELEEWLSSFTRLGFAAAAEEEGGPAVAGAVEHMAGQMTALHDVLARSIEARAEDDARLVALTAAVERLAETLAARTGADVGTAMEDLAAAQTRLAAAVEARTAEPEDLESRMRLRSIDMQLLRLLEEVAAGRQESMAELRHDFASLTRALTRRPGAGG